jgi:protein involved in polysaccharide export with SLBB domain
MRIDSARLAAISLALASDRVTETGPKVVIARSVMSPGQWHLNSEYLQQALLVPAGLEPAAQRQGDACAVGGQNACLGSGWGYNGRP